MVLFFNEKDVIDITLKDFLFWSSRVERFDFLSLFISLKPSHIHCYIATSARKRTKTLNFSRQHGLHIKHPNC
jgi:hypothetical protein